MLRYLKTYALDFSHLFFPHICNGCGTDVLADESMLCASCFQQLPSTGFISFPENVIEKLFYGRIKVEQAGSAFYFNKNSLIQHLAFELKYKGNKDIGFYLGKLLGNLISESGRFNSVDVIIPLPLNVVRQKKRGYNQAEEICKGITAVWEKPLITNAVIRNIFTETQTHKDRISRWQTMDAVFAVDKPALLQGKHILLVDDILTTGATMEACGNMILQVPDTRLSIATVAYTI